MFVPNPGSRWIKRIRRHECCLWASRVWCSRRYWQPLCRHWHPCVTASDHLRWTWRRRWGWQAMGPYQTSVGRLLLRPWLSRHCCQTLLALRHFSTFRSSPGSLRRGLYYFCAGAVLVAATATASDRRCLRSAVATTQTYWPEPSFMDRVGWVCAVRCHRGLVLRYDRVLRRALPTGGRGVFTTTQGFNLSAIVVR